LSRKEPGTANQAAATALIFAVLYFAVCVMGVGLGVWAMLAK